MFLYAVRVLGYVVDMEVLGEAICIGLFKFRIDLFHSFGIAFITPWYKVNGVSVLNFYLKSAKERNSRFTFSRSWTYTVS